MTVRFGNRRLGFYILTFLLAGTVLGIASHFANIFLSGHLDDSFIIFAIVVPALNIFVFLLALQWSQPWSESVILFVLGVLWLTLAAWSTDIIGHVQCYTLGDSRMDTKSGSIAAKAYCREMKVLQAFSWALFSIFVIAFYILFQLVSQAQRFGRWNIWSEPIRELPWFGEMPGYYNTNTATSPTMGYPQPQAGYPYGGYPMPMASAGGNTVVIQPGLNGAPPHVTTVPMSA